MSKPIPTPFNEDCIELALPVNPAYVSAARLTASSIANRLGFNIEDIEDIKAAVSEACTYLIKQNSIGISNMFKIKFVLKKESLEISLHGNQASESPPYDEDGLGILMIEALMDHVQLSSGNNAQIEIFMLKNLR